MLKNLIKLLFIMEAIKAKSFEEIPKPFSLTAASASRSSTTSTTTTSTTTTTTTLADSLPPLEIMDKNNNNPSATSFTTTSENNKGDDKKNNKKLNDHKIFKAKLGKVIENKETDNDKKNKYKDAFLEYVTSFSDKKEEYHNHIENGNEDKIKNKYDLWVESDKYIEKLNEESGNIGRYNHTQFSDWTLEEKKSILIQPEELENRRRLAASSCVSFAGWGSGSSTYNSFASYAQPIQNQGSCGDCWAFASIAQYELNYYRYKGISQKQSEQYVLDCTDNTEVGSCAGGWPSKSNLFLANYGSCPSYYSYTGNDASSCKSCFASKTPVGKAACITSSSTGYSGTSDNFWNIVVNAAQHVGLTYWMGIGNDFFYLSSSSPYYYSCSSIVGYHALAIHGQSYGNWLLLKNQWGTSWGNSGWFWLSKSAKTSCNFQADVSFNYW